MLSSETISEPLSKRLSILKSKTNKANLLIHEIYVSLQGESSHMGKPCIFIRTTGCHLRCSYCDTGHAFFAGSEISIDNIINKISTFNINTVELTGGEPLLQKASFELLKKLCDLNYTVLLETSGAVSIRNIDKRVKVILDIKTPSSGEIKKTVWHNLLLLWPGSEVKFVVSNIDDYLYAKQICFDYDLFNKTHVLISPVIAKIDPKIIAELMIKDRLKARFQLQLHRLLWGEALGK